MDFYDSIASEYDEITGAAGRGPRVAAFARELVRRYGIKSALDVACGTGIYTIELARLGVQTVGTDLSEGMLEQARRHAQAQAVSVEWVLAPMQELAGQFLRRFDAVLCMGNSILHLQTPAELETAARGFVQLLGPGGMVVLQLLNFVRVLTRQERIVGIDRQADREYVRFYDFLPEAVRFNILQIHWTGEQASHELTSTILKPYTHETLAGALQTAGCKKVELFSNLQFQPFDPEQSDTVMLVGHI